MLDDDVTAVSTEGGYVVLDLQPLVVQIGEQVAILGRVGARLPEDTGRIRIMKADDLETAQDLTQLFKQSRRGDRVRAAHPLWRSRSGSPGAEGGPC